MSVTVVKPVPGSSLNVAPIKTASDSNTVILSKVYKAVFCVIYYNSINVVSIRLCAYSSNRYYRQRHIGFLCDILQQY